MIWCVINLYKKVCFILRTIQNGRWQSSNTFAMVTSSKYDTICMVQVFIFQWSSKSADIKPGIFHHFAFQFTFLNLCLHIPE